MQKIPAFKHIDTNEGLSRVGGDEDFYLELLKSLHDDFNDAVDKYTLHKNAGDWENARILVHSVKGVAGNLGAKNLHIAAAALEDTIKAEEYEQTAETEKPFIKLHSQLMEELAGSGLLESSDENRALIPPEELKSALSVIVENGEKKKAGPCKNALKDLTAFAWPEDLQEELTAMSEALKKYKLPDAAAMAREIMKSLS